MLAPKTHCLLQVTKAYGMTIAAPQSDQIDIAVDLHSVDVYLFQSLKRCCIQKEIEMERWLAVPVTNNDVDVLEW